MDFIGKEHVPGAGQGFYDGMGRMVGSVGIRRSGLFAEYDETGPGGGKFQRDRSSSGLESEAREQAGFPGEGIPQLRLPPMDAERELRAAGFASLVGDEIEVGPLFPAMGKNKFLGQPDVRLQAGLLQEFGKARSEKNLALPIGIRADRCSVDGAPEAVGKLPYRFIACRVSLPAGGPLRAGPVEQPPGAHELRKPLQHFGTHGLPRRQNQVPVGCPGGQRQTAVFREGCAHQGIVVQKIQVEPGRQGVRKSGLVAGQLVANVESDIGQALPALQQRAAAPQVIDKAFGLRKPVVLAVEFGSVPGVDPRLALPGLVHGNVQRKMVDSLRHGPVAGDLQVARRGFIQKAARGGERLDGNDGAIVNAGRGRCGPAGAEIPSGRFRHPELPGRHVGVLPVLQKLAGKSVATVRLVPQSQSVGNALLMQDSGIALRQQIGDQPAQVP